MIKKKKRIVCEINRRGFKGGGLKSVHNSIGNMENFSIMKNSSLISSHARATNDVRIYRSFKILIASLLFTQTLYDVLLKIQGVDSVIQHHYKSKNPNQTRIYQSKNVSTIFRDQSRNFVIPKMDNNLVLFHGQQEPRSDAEYDRGLKKSFSNTIKKSLTNIKDSLNIDSINNRLYQSNFQPNDHGLYVEIHREIDDKWPIEISRYGEISIPISKYGDRKERSFLASKDKLFADGGKKNLIQSVNNLPTGGRHVANLNRQYLPNGPPPFKPSALMLGLVSRGAMEKLKRTSTFKRMYKSKAYYLFLDILRQLNLVAESISKKKMDLAQVQLDAIQTIINKLNPKSKHNPKLKWPLVMLNPQFVRELISSPTFLVMLFHAVEVGYMSMPGNFFLKPLVKLIAQPDPEKEEKIWWRRKRLYDTLNGHGSSELQPNLRTIHFRNPGEPTPIAIPTVVNIFRKLTNRPSPNPATFKQHFIYPSGSIPRPVSTILDLSGNSISDNDLYMNNMQEDAFLANQLKPRHPLDHKQSQGEESNENSQFQLARGTTWSQSIIKPEYFEQIASANQEDWLTHRPRPEQLLSKQEFDSLDPQDKERMMREIRDRFEESKWTNELIKQHSEFIETFSNSPDTMVFEPETQNSSENAQTVIPGEGSRGKIIVTQAFK